MDWRRVAIALVVVGLTIILVAVVDGRDVVVEHQTLSFHNGYVEMGPHDPGHYLWSVWVEDYYMGFEDGGFDVYASLDPPDDVRYSMFPGEGTTREFDHVECLLEHSWEPASWTDAPEGVYYCVDAGNPIWTEGDRVEVYLVRSGGMPNNILLAAGFVVLTVGLVIAVWKWRPKEG